MDTSSSVESFEPVNIFFKDLFGSKIASWLGHSYDASFKESLGLALTSALVFLFFLGTMMKRVGIVRYLGILVVVMVVYLTCVTVIQADSYVKEEKPEYQAFGKKKVFDYFLNFGLFIFAFNALPAFHQVYVQVKLPTVRRTRKIGIRVSLLLLCFYSLFTAAAYVSLGASMQDKDFHIFPDKQPLSSDPNDVYMKVLKAVFMVCLLSTYLVNSIPLKTQIMAELRVLPSPKSNLVVSAGICLLTGFLSWVYPDITNWFSILGSVGATSMISVLPTLCYYKGFRDNPAYRTKVCLALAWMLLTATLSFLCLVATILDMQKIHPDW